MDVAKTRKMKTTLKEAWTEATQKNKPPELAPVRLPSLDDSRISFKEDAVLPRKGEVIFDVSVHVR